MTAHRAPLPPGLAEAAAATLHAAFDGDPTALAAGAGPRAGRLLMRVPVDAAATGGGLLVVPGSSGPAPAGVAAWVPAAGHGGGLGQVLRSGSWLLLPLLGPRALARVVRDARRTDRLVAGYLRPDDAYLWVVGVRPEAQGRGLGGVLVRGVLADARRAGLARVVLVTHQADNVPLYRALGFDLVDDTARSRGHLLHVMARTA